MSEPNEVHLGDGLYASFDGFFVTLRAPRIGGDHAVVLEPDVLRAFQNFLTATAASAPAISDCWRLSPKDSVAFISALLSPPEPNDALKAGAEAYRARKGSVAP
jgi:hypothetical protein